MEWYLPITILPGLGMLIFSTTNQMMAISLEVGTLLSKKCTSFQHTIAEMKIKQITRLTIASTLLYFAAGAYVLSGMMEAMLTEYSYFSRIIMIIGTLAVFISLITLVIYSFATIKIRKTQFAHNHLKKD